MEGKGEKERVRERDGKEGEGGREEGREGSEVGLQLIARDKEFPVNSNMGDIFLK